MIKQLLYTSFHGNEATRYGHDQEKPLEEEYLKDHPGITISHPGLISHGTEKWLAGSPDGLATQPDGTRYLIEYKNPLSLVKAELTPMQACKSKALSCLVLSSSNQLQLKTTHEYFFQVQGLMEIMNLPFCHFVLSGFHSFCVISVQRDPSFFAKHLAKLRRFHFGAILPGLAHPMKHRRTLDGRIRTVLVDSELSREE